MKRHGYIFEKIADIDNLRLAHEKARKNKTFYREVKMIDQNTDEYLYQIQRDLLSGTYETSPYEKFILKDKGKERVIHKLPYYPDRIVHWAIMLQIEDVFLKTFIHDTHAAIPGRGIHSAYKRLDRFRKDKDGTKYCLKLDIEKFFPSINKDILKQLLRLKFKDERLLLLLDEIIDSSEQGVPIGNYLSQYFGNFYLSYMDHWLKEEKGVKYLIRYMDDYVILHHDKAFLHQLRQEIEHYATIHLKLKIKGNWQVFPSNIRGIDFVGYRHFEDYTLLRKSTAKRLKKKMSLIRHKNNLTYSEWCSINSYKGWTEWADCHNLMKAHIYPLSQKANAYYKEVIKGENQRNATHTAAVT